MSGPLNVCATVASDVEAQLDKDASFPIVSAVVLRAVANYCLRKNTDYITTSELLDVADQLERLK